MSSQYSTGYPGGLSELEAEVKIAQERDGTVGMWREHMKWGRLEQSSYVTNKYDYLKLYIEYHYQTAGTWTLDPDLFFMNESYTK